MRAGVWRALSALLLLSLVALLYGRALQVGLLSDDYLLFFQESPLKSAAYFGVVSSGHFIPGGAWLLYLQGRACGLDGACHHGLTLGLFACLALAVGWLGRQLGLSRVQALAAAALFASSSLPFELPLWANTTVHATSLLTGLAALSLFIRSGRDPISRGRWASAALFLLALTLHEQALGLLPAVALWTLFGEGGGEVARLLRRLAEPELRRRLVPWLIVAIFWVAVKLLIPHPGDTLPATERGLRAVVGGALYHSLRTFTLSLPAEWAWALLRPPIPGGFLLGPLAVVAAFVFVGRRLRGIERFLALWVLVQIALMCVASGMSSRHLAVPLVAASLLASSLLWRAAAWFSAGARTAAFLSAIGLLIALGSWQVRGKVEAYLASTRWVALLFRDAEAAIRDHPTAPRLLAQDLPDGVELGESEPAYALRYGFESEIERRFPGRFREIRRLRSSPPPPWAEPFGELVSQRDASATDAVGPTISLRCKGMNEGFEVGFTAATIPEGTGAAVTSPRP